MHLKLEEEQLAAARLAGTATTKRPLPYFMRQTVPNACGTIGILHAIGEASPCELASNAPIVGTGRHYLGIIPWMSL